ncbi:universal stress protein [Sulfuricystis multivorans]|uniref:universal stress protein n=1 Tax=Sulfuricystis multivorans TaxID=2211108 RepID=UPI000F81D1BA|nr:universal stress protein [Sulfuricystis multivorans]
MFERFIVATDLSPASEAMVGCLAGLAAFGARHALLLQCLDMQQAISTALSYSTAALEAVLARQKARLEAQGFEVDTRIAPGFAKSEINRIAQEEDYALIVVGSHGHNIVGEALLGGVASEVVHGATRPVLIVRLERRKESGEVCLLPADCDLASHVLFPTDFSANADHAFTVVEHLVASGARRVTLLHVSDAMRNDAEANDIERARLEDMRKRLERLGDVAVDTELAAGKPYLKIVEVARARGVHLIAMGSQGRGFVPELFLGSVSHQVARHAPAPVLLVPMLR